ncbi:hypothetical protein T439DRAFT_321820 [Meredithblackwellia eburnea MCA 4105]
MQQNLEAQRKTGALSAYEVEAVLAQYRLQSSYENIPNLPRSAPASQSAYAQSPKTSYSSHSTPLPDSAIASPSSLVAPDNHNDFTSYSIASSSSLSSYSAPSLAAATVPPVPYNPDDINSSSMPRSPSANSFKRGNNSLFGARVDAPIRKTASGTTMTKSPSTSSVSSSRSAATSSRKNSLVRRPSPPKLVVGLEQEENHKAVKTRESSQGSLDKGKHKLVEDESAGEEDEFEDDRDEEHTSLSVDDNGVPPLTQKQLNRISRALDSVAADLSAVYRMPQTMEEAEELELTAVTIASNESGAEHPTTTTTSSISDTEPMDPFLNRLGPPLRPVHSNASVSSLESGRRSTTPLSSSAPPPFVSRANATPTPTMGSGETRRPSVSSLVSNGSVNYVSPRSNVPATAPPPLDSPSPERPPTTGSSTTTSSSQSQSQSQSQNHQHQHRRRQSFESSTTHDPMSPSAFTFPGVPDRSADTSMSDDGGPFDLSYASTRGSGMTWAAVGTGRRRSSIGGGGPEEGEVEEEEEEMMMMIRRGRESVPPPPVPVPAMRRASAEKSAEKKRRAYAATSASTCSGIFSPGMNASRSSLGSAGSSYHPGHGMERLDADGDEMIMMGDDDDDELELESVTDEEESLNDGFGEEEEDDDEAPRRRRRRNGGGKPLRLESDDEDRDLLQASSTSMSRRPSNELLKEIAPPTGDGEADLALEDLVLIQETLVRSASRKAAARKQAVAAAALPANTGTSYPASEASSKRQSRGSRHSGGGRGGEWEWNANSRKRRSAERKSRTSISSGGAGGKAPSRQQQRASVASEASGKNGPTSSVMSPQTSEDSYGTKASPSTVDTPSTMQSDAFEFSNLVGSSIRRSSTDDDQELLTEEIPPVPALGAAVELEDNNGRVPRNMPLRRQNATPSVLIRDVRNQANIATMQLKKQGPLSPNKGSVARFKSIRHAPISHPQLIDAPEGLAVVPIANPAKEEDQDGLDGRSKAKNGIGLRFKMLLKKQSRDQLRNLNGDEVTPFVDFEASNTGDSPPYTPPEQSSAKFVSTPSDYPHTPDYPDTPDNRPPQIGGAGDNVRSPALSAVQESPEQGSPALSVSSTGGSSNGGGRSLGRFVSRFRRPRGESDAAVRYDEPRSSASSPRSNFASPEISSPHRRRPSAQGENIEQLSSGVYGLGFVTDSGRAPTGYEIGSPRSRASPRLDMDVPRTAPLAPQKRPSPPQLDLVDSANPIAAVTEPVSAPASSRHPLYTASMASTKSVDSMKKLWEAAEDLGMPRDKVQEFVELSYAQSPTSSTGKSIGRPRASSVTSSAVPSMGHQRSGSEASSRGTQVRRSNSTSVPRSPRSPKSPRSPRSVQDRPPTPPPPASHHRKASQEGLAAAGPVPDLPSPPSKKLTVDVVARPRNSLLSVRASTNGSLRPPASPGASSWRSSGYAGSIYDLYGGDESDAGGPASPGVEVEVEGAEEDNERRSTQDDGEIVWQVVGDLKNHRISAEDDFSFASTRSSLDSRASIVPPLPSDTRSSEPDPIQLLLHKRHRRKTSVTQVMDQAQMPGMPNNGRFPSIFLRDEERLRIVESQGGIAKEAEGLFLVRPPHFANGEDGRGLQVTIGQEMEH